MCASKIHVLLGLQILLGFCGCRGYCWGPAGNACDGGYGAYPPYGATGYADGYYDDCVEADYGYGGPAPRARRPSLRDRIMQRRAAHENRRENRRLAHRGGRPGRRRGGPIDGYDDCGCCEMDCCYTSCDECCMPMDSCCGDGGSFMDYDMGCDGMSGCSSCGSSGMDGWEMEGMPSGCPYQQGQSFDEMPYSEMPYSTEPGWEESNSNYVPYTHESRPTEAAPYMLNRGQQEPLQAPPSSDSIEGDFRSRQEESDVQRGPEAAMPLQRTRWVPSAF